MCLAGQKGKFGVSKPLERFSSCHREGFLISGRMSSQVLEEEMETLRIKESLRSYPEISQPLSNPHDPGGRTVPQVYGVGCFDFYFFFLLPGMSSYCVFV